MGQDNRTRLTAIKSCNVDSDSEDKSCNKVSIKTLVEDDYLDGDNNSSEVINPINKVNMADCVVSVYKKNNRVYAKYVNGDQSNANCEIN